MYFLKQMNAHAAMSSGSKGTIGSITHTHYLFV